MPRTQTDQEILIAPQEVRELLARLTEQSVEGIRADEPRTLAGLAIETGIPIAKLQSAFDELHGRKQLSWTPIVALLFVGAAAVAGLRYQPPLPNSQIPITPVQTPKAAPVETANHDGLVPLSQVKFGPDAGPYLADPNFLPSQALPEGISISVIIGDIIWGAGDAHAAAMQSPLSPQDEQRVRAALDELLRYAREDAARRKAPLSPDGSGIPSGYGGGYMGSVQITSYYGMSFTMANLLKLTPNNATLADHWIRVAVDKAIKQYQEQAKQREESQRPPSP